MSKQHKPHHHAKPGITNNNPDSLVKIVVTNDCGDWIRPNSGAKFHIDEQANFPEISFEFKSDAAPPYQWEWRIEWNAHVSGLREQVRNGRKLKQFTETGSFSSSEKYGKLISARRCSVENWL